MFVGGGGAGEGNVTIHIAMSEELAKKDVDCVITARSLAL